MTVAIHIGDCRDVLRTLPDESVHCCITSPPYWGLRDYGTAKWEGGDPLCAHLEPLGGGFIATGLGRSTETIAAQIRYRQKQYTDECRRCGAIRIDSQIGLEPDFRAYVAAMVEVFREVKRVLRKDGTLFLNMGDSYMSSGPRQTGRNDTNQETPGGRGGSFRGGERRAIAYDNGGKEPASSQVHDCFCRNLCGACRAAYRIGKSHSAQQHASKQPVSNFLSTHERMELLSDHSPMSGSTHQGDRNSIATQDQRPFALREDALLLVSRVSKIGESDQQPFEIRSLASNQDAGCRLCGHSLVDYAPGSVDKTDCNCGIGEPSGASGQSMSGKFSSGSVYLSYTTASLKPKDLCGIPWRVAFALQEDGWWLRQDIIWAKPNPMPESITDRCTKSHEYLFLLSKSERYYYDAEAIREENSETSETGGTYRNDWKHLEIKSIGATSGMRVGVPIPRNGRNKRSVWEIATAPYSDAHFATFPPALIEPAIKAGTSERGCCAKCGAPWRRVQEIEKSWREDACQTEQSYGPGSGNRMVRSSNGGMSQSRYSDAGWSPSCKCDAPTVPCTVLDPFGGAGTTGLVADRLQRSAILIELNPDYSAMSERRIVGDAPLFVDVSRETWAEMWAKPFDFSREPKP